MNSIDRLTALFTKFPGIGMRQARRFVYFFLTVRKDFVDELIEALSVLKSEVHQCNRCYRFFEYGSSSEKSCSLCVGKEHKPMLIVVEKDVDLENIKKGEMYEGYYFVLGGLLTPLQKESFVRVRELLERVKNDAEKGILKEVVIALGVNPNGNYTTLHLKKLLSPIAENHALSITTLGRGMSTGTELEYSDAETLKHAFENRK